MSLVTAGPGAMSAAADDATSSVFVGRVAVALSALSQVILGESDATANHDLRIGLAGQAQKSPQGIASWVVWAVTADMTTGVGSTDQAILDRIESLWDQLAGAI